MKKDIAIIGAGPAGLFASFYCGIRGLNSTIIDALDTPGGRLTALYPEKYIYDVAGFPKIKANNLVNNLTEQLDRFRDITDWKLSQNVIDLKKNDDGFIIKTNKEKIEAKSIIIAAGTGAFKARKLGLEHEETANNIYYSVKNIDKFKNKKVAIFGGGDSALDWALMLEEVADEVHIIHRRNEFRAHQHSIDNLKKSTVQIHTPFKPKELISENNQITSLVLESKEVEKKIEIDDIIVNYGFVANLGSIEKWGLNIEKGKIIVNSQQQTNIDGIHAIGDICNYPGKTELIVSGFGEGPTAVSSCFKYIYPGSEIATIHSSSLIKE